MATAQPQIRTYEHGQVIAFRKTREAYGGLSNMAAGYPLLIDGVRIGTSEALYQACRFPLLPQVQQLIIAETSPMTAKMRSKPYRSRSREDWDHIRIPVMKWCLRVKLAQNWERFGELLLETGDRPIVEDSSKDNFWGAIRDENGIFHGRNVLGRLLMELREILRSSAESLEEVPPVAIPDFLLFGRDIPAVRASRKQLTPAASASQPALSFQEPTEVRHSKRDAMPTPKVIEPGLSTSLAAERLPGENDGPGTLAPAPKHVERPSVYESQVPYSIEPPTQNPPSSEREASGRPYRKTAVLVCALAFAILILWLVSS